MGGWVGPRASLDTMEWRNISLVQTSIITFHQNMFSGSQVEMCRQKDMTGVPDRTHKAYFPITSASNPTNCVSLCHI
jgi:hypothetical protein